MGSLHSIQHLHVGGIPTGPDVRALMEKFSDHGPGSSVSYAEIEAVIHVASDSCRFKTVVTAWRRALMRERNIASVREPLAGCVRFLAEHERAGDAFQGFRRSVKGIGRSLGKAATIRTERLGEAERNTATHVKRVIEATYSSARGATKELAANFTPPKQLPRAR